MIDTTQKALSQFNHTRTSLQCFKPWGPYTASVLNSGVDTDGCGLVLILRLALKIEEWNCSKKELYSYAFHQQPPSPFNPSVTTNAWLARTCCIQCGFRIAKDSVGSISHANLDQWWTSPVGCAQEYFLCLRAVVSDLYFIWTGWFCSSSGETIDRWNGKYDGTKNSHWAIQYSLSNQRSTDYAV